MKTHSAANLFPLLADDELRLLAADIRAHGLRKPIVLLDGQVLDGRNRLAACKLANVEPRYVRLTAADVPDPIAYVLSENLHRRHLSESQRAMVAARAADAYTEQARQRSRANLRRGKQGPDSADVRSRDGADGKSSAIAGEALNVGTRSVEYAQTVLRRGSPELISLVDRDEVSVSRAARIAREVAPEEQHLEVVYRRTHPELRVALRQMMADGVWRTRAEIVDAVRRTGLTGIPDREIHAAILGAGGNGWSLDTDGRGRWRLERTRGGDRGVQLYRRLGSALDQLDQLARSETAGRHLPRLQPLAQRIRRRMLEAIPAIAQEAAESNAVPAYTRPAPMGRPRRRILLPPETTGSTD